MHVGDDARKIQVRAGCQLSHGVGQPEVTREAWSGGSGSEGWCDRVWFDVEPAKHMGQIKEGLTVLANSVDKKHIDIQQRRRVWISGAADVDGQGHWAPSS